MIENIKRSFPWLVRDMQEARELSGELKDMLLIMTVTGEKYIYDDRVQTIRLVTKASDISPEDRVKHEFGYRLKKMMELRNITQSGLAVAMGISQGTISQCVNGNVNPSLSFIARLAEILKCHIEDLYQQY